MAAGDVTVQIVENFTTTTLDTAVTSLRASVGASGKIYVEPIHNDQDVLLVGIEEA